MAAKDTTTGEGRDRSADPTDGAALERLNANLSRVDELTKRLVAALGRREAHDPGLQGPGADLYARAMAAYWAEMAANPGKMIERQVGYWGRALREAFDAQQAMLGARDPEVAPSKDKRFKDPLWSEHPYYAHLRRQYEIGAEAVRDAVADLSGLDASEARRVQFFSQQIVDLFSPTNFLATNPEAMRRAVETEGASLVTGLENLVRDIEANQGDWLVTLSDPDAFELGENLATTPGEVVFRNRMIEVIQYAPRTDEVRATPIVLFPPWINKFYILDLKPQNSLVRWIVEQGYTLFVVSWVNPDETYADVGMDDYVQEGFLQAMDVAREITGEGQVNAVGYCIAGTTLSATLALLAKRGDDRVRSATFFTTLADFSDPGEMGVFLGEDFVQGIEREAAQKGFLDKFFMGRTFSYLRARDLVYGPAVKAYMMGEAPPAFDLLHWNGDGTNLPGPMVSRYLRELCVENRLADGGWALCGETVTLGDVDVPLMSIACETDHIAHWRGAFETVKAMGSEDKTFVLSESGHIAGIVNPPSKKKYGHYTRDGRVEGAPEDWFEAATFHEGSWWPRWSAWLAERSGKMVPAREPGSKAHPPICPAPGTYVLPKG
ncbi:class I poly(R)-hydroxyalkanoic acid synthase [Jannaschia sp. Os4]|uniref:PHA/PHB synthase family protein n=1 Tax=Jannaschia sp. Os4 TaxID=2807617 RepID=UPI001939D0BB|nr:class I poly(R)-hydroxyalkanoic acid synthase [Jannaschia sp. Os4]MBM2577772.1 class I poly(R)-hydroxyalkanoic acid synthase [Jannaschia sp. Os4]